MKLTIILLPHYLTSSPPIDAQTFYCRRFFLGVVSRHAPQEIGVNFTYYIILYTPYSYIHKHILSYNVNPYTKMLHRMLRVYKDQITRVQVAKRVNDLKFLFCLITTNYDTGLKLYNNIILCLSICTVKNSRTNAGVITHQISMYAYNFVE